MAIFGKLALDADVSTFTLLFVRFALGARAVLGRDRGAAGPAALRRAEAGDGQNNMLADTKYNELVKPFSVTLLCVRVGSL